MARLCKVEYFDTASGTEAIHTTCGHDRRSADREAEWWVSAHPDRTAVITEYEAGDWESRITRNYLPDGAA